MLSKPFKFLRAFQTSKSTIIKFASFISRRMKIASTFTLPDLPSPEHTIETAELNLLSDPHGTFPRFHPLQDSEARFRAISDQLQPSALLSRQLALSNLFSLRFDRFTRWSELVILFFSVSLCLFLCFCIESTMLTLFVAPNRRLRPSIRRHRASFPRRNSPFDWTKPELTGFHGFHDSIFAGSNGGSVCERGTAGNRLFRAETLGFGELFPLLFLLFPFPRFPNSIVVLLRYYQDRNQPLRAGTLARQLYEHNRGSFHAALLYAKVFLEDESEKEKVESILVRCHALNPKHIETAHLLGLLFYRQRRYEEAIRILGESLDRDVPVEIKQLLCECYLKNGDSIPYLRLQYLIKWSVCNKKRTFLWTWMHRRERGECLCSTSRAYREHTQKRRELVDQQAHRERTTNSLHSLNKQKEQFKNTAFLIISCFIDHDIVRL